MNLTLKCMVINLGTLEEVLVSHSEKHIFNKPLSILPTQEDVPVSSEISDFTRCTHAQSNIVHAVATSPVVLR